MASAGVAPSRRCHVGPRSDGRNDAGTGPDLPGTVLLEAAEWQALSCASPKTPSPPRRPPSLHQAVRWIAQLGGCVGRTSDGAPGATVLWRGLQRLTDLTLLFQVFSPAPTS